MQTAGTRSGFTQQKPVGEFANSNTTEALLNEQATKGGK